ncbi:hypothetical protein ARMSODRAFT_958529 [Armillaria solidipes]|uniref:Uncharacterized protein n=1 Tax=Armillaria solidipes TaxID=1076256 RepID=A0A2H3BTS8_9AGAR|nr:hypothetical protein ARMSODRAFT_958529 [Armillaria solidipes]
MSARLFQFNRIYFPATIIGHLQNYPSARLSVMTSTLRINLALRLAFANLYHKREITFRAPNYKEETTKKRASSRRPMDTDGIRKFWRRVSISHRASC